MGYVKKTQKPNVSTLSGQGWTKSNNKLKKKVFDYNPLKVENKYLLVHGDVSKWLNKFLKLKENRQIFHQEGFQIIFADSLPSRRSSITPQFLSVGCA